MTLSQLSMYSTLNTFNHINLTSITRPMQKPPI